MYSMRFLIYEWDIFIGEQQNENKFVIGKKMSDKVE